LGTHAGAGVLLGLLTAVFIGLFMVPRRYFRGDTLTFLVGMSFGAMVGNAVYWLLAGRPFQCTWHACVALLPGANWAVGTYAYAAGTQRVGLSKATGIKNTQVVVTTLGAFLIFGEQATTQPHLAFLGAALVVATAFVLSRTEHRSEALPDASLAGYLIPIIAGVLYGVNGLVMKWLISAGVARPQLNLGIGVGAFLGGAGLYAVVNGSFRGALAPGARQTALAALGGLIWAAGLVTMIVSIAWAGVAVAWSLLNLSIVVSVLYGVFVFREIDARRRWLQLAAGLSLACLGVSSLYLSRVVGGGG